MPVLTQPDPHSISFHCPGCKSPHVVAVNAPTGRSWTWNKDAEKPTLAPSILLNQYDLRGRCHFTVTDGVIQFLHDCSHTRRGQRIPMGQVKG